MKLSLLKIKKNRCIIFQFITFNLKYQIAKLNYSNHKYIK